MSSSSSSMSSMASAASFKSSISCCEYSKLVFNSATDLTTLSILVFTEDKTD